MQLRHVGRASLLTLAFLCTTGFRGCYEPVMSPGDDSFISGTYDGEIENGPSTCPGTWRVGDVNDFTVVLSENDGDVQLAGEGGYGLYMDIVFGTRVLAGDATADGSFDAALVGRLRSSLGDCEWNTRADVSGRVIDDELTGVVTYTPITNGHPDCVAYRVEDCSTEQTFTGVRR